MCTRMCVREREEQGNMGWSCNKSGGTQIARIILLSKPEGKRPKGKLKLRYYGSVKG
jgi:hypothetical protein